MVMGAPAANEKKFAVPLSVQVSPRILSRGCYRAAQGNDGQIESAKRESRAQTEARQ